MKAFCWPNYNTESAKDRSVLISKLLEKRVNSKLSQRSNPGLPTLKPRAADEMACAHRRHTVAFVFRRQENEPWCGGTTTVGCWLFSAGPCAAPSVYNSLGSLALSGKQVTNGCVLVHSCTQNSSNRTTQPTPTWLIIFGNIIYYFHQRHTFSQMFFSMFLRILPKDANEIPVWGHYAPWTLLGDLLRL